jgi:hypothetical protein
MTGIIVAVILERDNIVRTLYATVTTDVISAMVI